MLLGYLLQLIEGFLTIACLVSARLRHAAHPFQLGAVKVIGTGYLGIGGINALLTFLQVIAVVSLI